jgi:hypothetical protein
VGTLAKREEKNENPAFRQANMKKTLFSEQRSQQE